MENKKKLTGLFEAMLVFLAFNVLKPCSYLLERSSIQVFSIRFGFELVLTAQLFGAAHGLNTFIFLAGRYEFSVWWGLWIVFSGFFFGLIRENSGSIVASSLVHGVVDAVGESMSQAFGLME